MSEQPLITKYRPDDLDQCIGNKEVLKALSSAIASPSHPHTYLFTGPSGVGKTTISRILAKKFNCTITEIDAASESGVENSRVLVELSGFRPITEQPNHLYIIDEAHALSKQAWGPYLKLSEQPPEYLYICFCTTESNKVPDTIKTRSYPVSLKPIKAQEIDDLLSTVADIEGWKVSNDVMQSIVMAAEGSARMGLTLLQAGHACQTRDELSQIVDKVTSDQSPAIGLIRYLMTGKREWRTVADYLKKIENFEQAITDVSIYLASALSRSEEQQAHEFWLMLQKFTKDVTWDKRVQFYSAVGGIIWGQIPF